MNLTRRFSTLLVAATLASGSAVANPIAAVVVPTASALESVSESQQGRPDLVVVTGRRGSETSVTGTLLQAHLDEVRISVDGEELTYKPDRVVRIQLNQVPESFSDGRKHMAARRFAEAAAAFGKTASDSKQREPVRAAALLEAIAAEVAQSGKDAAAVGRARELAARFLKDFPQSRDLPEARRWSARLAHVAGDTAAAVEGYAALAKEFDGSKATVGYDPLLCLEAGLQGAHAALDGGDTSRARDLFASLEQASTAYAASLDATDPRAVHAEALRERAQLGEGWILLSGNKGTQARGFFKSRVEGDQLKTDQARFEARIGYAKSLEAGKELREAQVQYAMVSAAAYGDRDLVARALVGLSATSLALGDTDARAQATTWLTEVAERYPDTPAARTARAELEKLR
ncbi:MAG: hypothetical protein R3F34_13740 [Planctomycetota bacterium]